MKKALFALATVAMASSAFADANIIFANRNIPTAAGTAQYNVPIFQEGGLGVAGKEAGLLAGGVTVGLFFNGTQLLTAGGAPVQSALRTDATNAKFFATGSQTANVPGVSPGVSQTLEVRAWQGSSFASAKSTPGQSYGTWTFTSQKLGGIDAGGNTTFTPNMTGWGPEDGTGLALTITPVPEPTTIAFGAIGIGALLLRRRK